MARPEKRLTPEQVAEVETLAAVLTVGQMADYFGIGRTTFFAIIEREAEVAERYKRGKARAIGAIAQSLISKARGGDTTSMIFYLKTQAGWRETDRLKHTGAEGGPITSIVRQIVSPTDKLRTLIEGYAERQVGPAMDHAGASGRPGQPLSLADTDPAAEATP
ncbi:hypothetical protein ACOI1H_24220 [Loktanella sp. DJP18]|uniref:hypothetical protein n=1 Tax=Loktanella sp. DJP18 TaxID=3409788 RepID=UPI003BB60D17